MHEIPDVKAKDEAHLDPATSAATAAPRSDPAATAARGDEAAGDVLADPLPWGRVLRLALLRGLVLGLALGLALAALVGTFGLITMVTFAGAGFPPGPQPLKLLGAMLGVAALGGGFSGVTFAPLALLELVCARSDRPAVHARGAALSFVLTLGGIVPLLVLQIVYAVTLYEQGFDGAPGRALDVGSDILKGLRLFEVCLFAALVSPVPFAIFARLRGWAHRRQLAFVVPASLVAAGTSCLLSLGLMPHSGGEEKFLLVVLTGVATILGALLPGVFARADQLERWVVRKLWPEEAAASTV